MPTYCVSLHGNGISVEAVGESDAESDFAPTIGFYTSRISKAENEEEATLEAVENVLLEWREGGEYFEVNKGGIPKLEFDSIRKLGFVEALLGTLPRKGYTFYKSADPDDGIDEDG